MLNLVKLQERLRMYPQQAIDAYANGANPEEVPPYMALSENLRRKQLLEEDLAQEAQKMEGAPNIKDKLSQEVMGLKQAKEQAAGLMALQGNRQRQAAQQQASVQSNLAMAAPNTTTSEPAQLAGGGFIDDIVVPRDYAPGGSVIDPETLKRLMMREAMQGDVADIPKELTNAVGRAALRRRPGIAGVPLPMNMFKRSDYAGGGIVAFAGPDGSVVEDIVEKETREIEQRLRQDYSPEAKRVMQQQAEAKKAKEATYLQNEQQRLLNLSREIMGKGAPRPAATPTAVTNLPQANYSNEGRAYQPGGLDARSREPRPQGIQSLLQSQGRGETGGGIATPKTTPELDFLRKLYNKPDFDVAAELRARGLDVRPQSRAAIDELERQRQQVQGEDTFANRLLSLTPGRRFGTGETGRGLVAYEKEQSAKLRQIGLDIAKIKDLETQADFAHKMGNFKLERELLDKAEDNKRDAAKTAGQIGVNLEQIAAQREGTAAQRESTQEATRSRLTNQLEGYRLRELNQYLRPIDDQIKQIQNFAAMGQPLSPSQKAQLEALQRQKIAIEAQINQKYDQKAAAIGGAGDFRVIGVKPGQ